MTIFLLIRHATTDYVGRALAGRTLGIHLNREGQVEAGQLADRLSSVSIDAIYSSPLERTLETAEHVSRRRGIAVEISEAFIEIDCGIWTGRNFGEMGNDPRWSQFNLFRSGSRIPGGEQMLEVQARAVVEIERLRDLHPNETVAVVTHADVIRAAVIYYAGVPIDLMLRMEISPASLTAISIDDYGPRIHCVNHTGDLPKAIKG